MTVLKQSDHLWDVSTPWLESTCGLTADKAYQSKNQAVGLKELPAELRDRDCAEAQISGRLQKLFAALKEHTGLHYS